MKSVRPWLIFGAIVLIAPLAAFAQSGEGAKTLSPAGATPQSISSHSTVTVTIPATIGIDVESDFAFDFSTYAAPAAHSASATCVDNVFPPTPGCTGNIVYAASSVTTTPGAPNQTAGDLWIAIFSTKDLGAGNYDTMTVSVTAGAFSTSPGFTADNIRLLRHGQNASPINGATFGPASATKISALTGGNLKVSGAFTSSTFGWTRIDLRPDLQLPASTPFVECAGCTALVNFTLGY